ncbi:zinc-binding alcohol dehydrogenase family protein [Leuconostocaceae bacterium ESL0958]|nr:zinc-binding alcohol dehydrogenase family protein [Leuconostocaceae bacterium ESL0958]
MQNQTVFQRLINYFRLKMNAVGVVDNPPLSDKDAFVSRQVNKPMPKPDEVLVNVRASAVNPVDTKMRAGYQDQGVFRIFGLDVLGVITAVGAEVHDFKVGDRVFYAGTQHQSGADASYQVVKAALIAKAPANLSDVEAAAMPLTSITAYDAIAHGFGLPVEKDAGAGKTVLIINGAGGVGSVLIQMAKFEGMTVIATAGTKDSKDWVAKMGADHVLDYHDDLASQMAELGYQQVDYIANLQDTTAYWDLMVKLIKPYGKIAAIVETSLPVDLGDLKAKSAGFSWVFMLARGNENYDLQEQGRILRKVAKLLAAGDLKSTVRRVYHGLTPENVRLANADVVSHHMIGKVVIDFDEVAGTKIDYLK